MYMTLRKPAAYNRKALWSKKCFYCDIDQREIELNLSLVECQEDLKRLVVLDFFNNNAPITIPNGVIMTNNMESRAPFKTVIPKHEQDFHMEMSLEEGFKVLYLGQALVSAPPNIEGKRQIKNHQFRANPSKASKKVVVTAEN